MNECFRSEWIRRKFDLESNMKLSKSIDRADGNCLSASCCSDEIVEIYLEDNEKNYRREKSFSLRTPGMRNWKKKVHVRECPRWKFDLK